MTADSMLSAWWTHFLGSCGRILAHTFLLAQRHLYSSPVLWLMALRHGLGHCPLLEILCSQGLTRMPLLTFQGPGQTVLYDILPCLSTLALQLLAQVFALQAWNRAGHTCIVLSGRPQKHRSQT